MTYKNIYNNAWCRTSSIFHDKLDNDNDLRQPLPLATSLYSQYKLVVFLVGFQHNRLMAFISPAALLMITIPPPQDGHHCEWYIFLSIQSWWWWTASYPPCSCQCMSIKAQASSIAENQWFVNLYFPLSDHIWQGAQDSLWLEAPYVEGNDKHPVRSRFVWCCLSLGKLGAAGDRGPLHHFLNGSLTGPLTGPLVVHSYIFHNRSKICR